MSDKPPLIAYISSGGISFIHGPPKEGDFDGFPRVPYLEFGKENLSPCNFLCKETSRLCKSMIFSEDGGLFAYTNGEKVNVVSTATFESIFQVNKPQAADIQFSPKGTYLCTWEPYVPKGSAEESCNLEIYDIKEKSRLKGFIQKKRADWHPAWTDDEVLCSRSVSNEVHFYENGDFSKIGKKIYVQKVSAFSLSPGAPSYHVACYIPGVKGQPSFVRLFMFPNFEGGNAVIAQKSFYKADKAEFYWHKLGKDLLVQATVDVDKSGASYYGEQFLYYLSVKGETAKVSLGKDGPVYSVKWSPSSLEFCVVYGYMPAKATIYNTKCEPVFDFDIGPRNEVNYSMSGNKLALSGFGNLRGNIEIWDLKKKKLINKFIATDSTYISWSPDGEYILTATTSPRLRIGNGYRIWHYTGSLLQERFVGIDEEIFDLKWLPMPELQEKPTSYTPVQGIQSSQPQASKEAYRPPAAKGQPSSFRLHSDDSSNKPDAAKAQPLTKNQKKNLAKKAKKAQQEEPAVEPIKDDPANNENDEPIAVPTPHINSLTGNPDKDKRVKALYKKLDQIEKLKKERSAGKPLEKNQLEKLKKEHEIIEELQNLTL